MHQGSQGRNNRSSTTLARSRTEEVINDTKLHPVEEKKIEKLWYNEKL